jgi:hypothetical protein
MQGSITKQLRAWRSTVLSLPPKLALSGMAVYCPASLGGGPSAAYLLLLIVCGLRILEFYK